MSTTAFSGATDQWFDLEILADTTEYKQARINLDDRIAAERVRIAAQIAEGDAQTAAKRDELIEAGRASFARHQQLIADLKAEGATLNTITARRVGLTGLWDQERSSLEARLRETASPLIAAFIDRMRDELDRTYKMPFVEDNATITNLRTGRKTRIPGRAVVTPSACAQAIRNVLAAAEAMKVVSDQASVPALLGELESRIPVVGADVENRGRAILSGSEND